MNLNFHINDFAEVKKCIVDLSFWFQEGAFGFDSCLGCRHCDCDASAALVQLCDPRSGACTCQPGVNGPNCRQCAPGHWDYGPNGCKSESRYRAFAT